jgi:Family of unknown function (DUF6496)
MPRGGGKETVHEVMGKFKRRELYSGPRSRANRPLVDSRDQAIAIALSEAGLSNKPKKPYMPRERYPRGPR